MYARHKSDLSRQREYNKSNNKSFSGSMNGKSGNCSNTKRYPFTYGGDLQHIKRDELKPITLQTDNYGRSVYKTNRPYNASRESYHKLAILRSKIKRFCLQKLKCYPLCTETCHIDHSSVCCSNGHAHESDHCTFNHCASKCDDPCDDPCNDPCDDPCDDPCVDHCDDHCDDPCDVPCHTTTKSPCHTTTKSPCHTTTKSPCHTTTKSPCHTTTKSPCHTTTKSPCHTTTKSPCHTTTKDPRECDSVSDSDSNTNSAVTDDSCTDRVKNIVIHW
jgi:hypothetical protein